MNAAHKSPVAIVTGAGAGVGRATAIQLVQLGYRVALASRTKEDLIETASAAGPRAQTLIVPTDVAIPEQVRHLVEHTHATFGRIDALVNNAGVAPLLPIDQTDPETLHKTFAINALGPGYAIHALWPIFKAQRSGRVVNVSTLGTADPFPGFFAYAASKASVNLYAKSIAIEGADIGVRAFAVAPGAIETNMLREHFDEATIPQEACLTPETVAGVIVECVTGERDAENGQTLFLSQT